MIKYEKIKEIGKGNYGKAILVRNKINKNLYVLKSIDTSNFCREQLENAIYEANVIKSLNHPFIIKYIESFFENKTLCIIMEYADCGDLYKLIRCQKKINIHLKEQVIMNWFVQICFAIKYIHDKKILHRDLKLSNIFLSSNGDIKLGDFGIAKVLDNSDEFAKTIVGTPYYLSPEICLRRPYNQKSDIWSLGCILYELMNMKHAFEASNIGELILKILKGEVDNSNQSFSNESINLICELLNTDCEKRPDINSILEKPFLLKYIKMNLIKKLTSKDSELLSEEKESESFQSSENVMNLKFKSIPLSEKDNSSKEFTENELKKGCNITIVSDEKQGDSLFTKIEKLKTYLENFFGLENFLDIYFKVSNHYIVRNKKPLYIDFSIYNIFDKNTINDVIKLLKALVKLENKLYNQ